MTDTGIANGILVLDGTEIMAGDSTVLKRAQSTDFNDLTESDVEWLPEVVRDPKDLMEGVVYGYYIVRRHGLRMKVKHD